jgi:hypothetical protein
MPKIGGNRKGAGRPPGALTKRSQEIRAEAVLTGMTPLEVMLAAMHHYQELGDYDKAALFAKDAAPYMHPRLASVEHAGKNNAAHERSFTITIGNAKINEEKRPAHLDS